MRSNPHAAFEFDFLRLSRSSLPVIEESVSLSSIRLGVSTGLSSSLTDSSVEKMNSRLLAKIFEIKSESSVFN
ncbi:hypothetical protein BpHYR1_051034 [Brachionus plicatilis]|uniref:Uncharacterized protein n=1 Tax=Brachionus plicatilis TaxID=10195 RepID=A0A3M7SQR2_BRAPC|nr:hypothetical protein BpHYR1_051034 [Brachionus plicatilis]